MENSNNRAIITSFSKKIKYLARRDIFLLVLLLSLMVLMFFLGRLSTVENTRKKEEQPALTIKYPDDYRDRLDKRETKQEEASFLASKNGTRYYPLNCKSANRITPANKIFFTNEKDAQMLGLSRASNCQF